MVLHWEFRSANVEFGPALRTLVFAGERRAHLI
jgi:hypothetical protein